MAARASTDFHEFLQRLWVALGLRRDGEQAVHRQIRKKRILKTVCSHSIRRWLTCDRSLTVVQEGRPDYRRGPGGQQQIQE